MPKIESFVSANFIFDESMDKRCQSPVVSREHGMFSAIAPVMYFNLYIARFIYIDIKKKEPIPPAISAPLVMKNKKACLN